MKICWIKLSLNVVTRVVMQRQIQVSNEKYKKR